MIRVRAAREPDGPVVFGQAAPILRRNGYAPISWGWGRTEPDGPWKRFRLLSGDANAGCGIVCVEPPNFAHGHSDRLDTCTHVAALECDVFDRKAAQAINEFVCSRLRWPHELDRRLRRSPIRVAADRTSLRLFQLIGQPFAHLRTRDFVLPHDKPRALGYRRHRCSWACVESVVAVSALDPSSHESMRVPYQWRDGDPLSVPRSQLPVIDAAEAENFIAAISAILDGET